MLNWHENGILYIVIAEGDKLNVITFPCINCRKVNHEIGAELIWKVLI